ncbi:MAG: hypothetical protein GTO14_16490 [Anaerolineales bacterium]|nr:hypothetical protein [Anaerolineales bacterium]
MMFTWQDVLVAEQKRADALRMAERERLIRTILRAREPEPRFYHGLMVRFGGWMESVGQGLKKRYTVVVEPSIPSTVQTNKGCIL